MTSFAIAAVAVSVAALYFGRIAANYREIENIRKELQKIIDNKEGGDD
ncbi:MAG: hypothetical protein IIZ12_03575 [Eggerthellaceae bacterium]|nr:hypothetical protein [Eggerthellaceae bacterium]